MWRPLSDSRFGLRRFLKICEGPEAHFPPVLHCASSLFHPFHLVPLLSYGVTFMFLFLIVTVTLFAPKSLTLVGGGTNTGNRDVSSAVTAVCEWQSYHGGMGWGEMELNDTQRSYKKILSYTSSHDRKSMHLERSRASLTHWLHVGTGAHEERSWETV